SVLDHDFKSLAARLLTKLREESDVAADQCLQASADCAEDRARTHGDAAHDAEIAHDAEARQFERGRDHVMRDRITRRRDGIGSWYVNLVIHTSISRIQSPADAGRVSHRFASLGECNLMVCAPRCS